MKEFIEFNRMQECYEELDIRTESLIDESKLVEAYSARLRSISEKKETIYYEYDAEKAKLDAAYNIVLLQIKLENYTDEAQPEKKKYPNTHMNEPLKYLTGKYIKFPKELVFDSLKCDLDVANAVIQAFIQLGMYFSFDSDIKSFMDNLHQYHADEGPERRTFIKNIRSIFYLKDYKIKAGNFAIENNDFDSAIGICEDLRDYERSKLEITRSTIEAALKNKSSQSNAGALVELLILTKNHLTNDNLVLILDNNQVSLDIKKQFIKAMAAEGKYEIEFIRSIVQSVKSSADKNQAVQILTGQFLDKVIKTSIQDIVTIIVDAIKELGGTIDEARIRLAQENNIMLEGSKFATDTGRDTPEDLNNRNTKVQELSANLDDLNFSTTYSYNKDNSDLKTKKDLFLQKLEKKQFADISDICLAFEAIKNNNHFLKIDRSYFFSMKGYTTSYKMALVNLARALLNNQSKIHSLDEDGKSSLKSTLDEFKNEIETAKSKYSRFDNELYTRALTDLQTVKNILNRSSSNASFDPDTNNSPGTHY